MQNNLQPISLLAYSPLWILGKEALPPNSAPEFISWLKARNATTTFGTIGAGSAAQLAAVSFGNAIGVKFQYVPYRGAGPAIQDLLSGQIDISCLEASSTLPYVQAGKMKAYAVVGEQHWPKSPETPPCLWIRIDLMTSRAALLPFRKMAICERSLRNGVEYGPICSRLSDIVSESISSMMPLANQSNGFPSCEHLGYREEQCALIAIHGLPILERNSWREQSRRHGAAARVMNALKRRPAPLLSCFDCDL